MRVMRLLQNPYCTEYKRWALLLYSLQIACSNLKNFMAEQPKAEADEGEQPQPKIASAEKEKKVSSKGGEEPSLAGLLLGLLANGPNGDPDAPPPRIRNREDYEAAVKHTVRQALLCRARQRERDEMPSCARPPSRGRLGLRDAGSGTGKVM
jgi:hypothetical protein